IAVRPRPSARDSVRTRRHLWPLDQDQTLVPGLPTEASQQLPPAEVLRPLGATAMSLFRAEDIAIRFGGIRAVDAVTFDVLPGEVFSIIGPNGAGKTTIFKLISRIYAPTSGRLFFQDRDITNVPPYRIAGLGIARTFQNIELFANATLLQNLLIGRHCHSTVGVLSELVFTPAVKREELKHRE